MFFAPPAAAPPVAPPNDLKPLEIGFFALCTLFCLIGGVTTVAAKNPIRGAMGLLVTIIGIAGMYLLLSAELLAAIQVIVYAGAVVILFLFVIMLLGPSVAESSDARGAVSRYFGAGVFVVAAAGILYVVMRTGGSTLTTMPPPPAGLGTIEVIGRELFTSQVVPFQIAGVLLLIAVVGAVTVARGRGPEDGAIRSLVKTQSTTPLLPQQTRLEVTGVPPISAKGTAASSAHGGGHAASKAALAPNEEVPS
jgi:NADH-quinone oxidoreductase subunit J